MRQVFWVLACAVGLIGCGGDDDDSPPSYELIEACGRIIDVVAERFITCRMIIDGELVTSEQMAAARDYMVARCVDDPPAEIDDPESVAETPCSVVCRSGDGCAP